MNQRYLSCARRFWISPGFLPHALVGIAILAGFSFPTGCFAAEKPSPGKSGGEAEGKEPPTRKARKTSPNSERKNLNDPQTLSEIIEKTINASESAGTAQDPGNPDLPVKGRISSTVGPRHDPINGILRFHKGIDIAIPEGTPVTPVAPGKVAYSGLQPGYGNMVIVQHDDGMISIYAHHSRNLARTGTRVTRETKIAYSGSTGHSTGPHLHFEAWQGGVNVTEAFLPNFSGRHLEESVHGSLETTNLRRMILKDGTVLFVDVGRAQK